MKLTVIVVIGMGMVSHTINHQFQNIKTVIVQDEFDSAPLMLYANKVEDITLFDQIILQENTNKNITLRSSSEVNLVVPITPRLVATSGFV